MLMQQSEAEVVLFSWHGIEAAHPSKTVHATVQIVRLQNCSEVEAVESKAGGSPTAPGSGSRPGVMAAPQAGWGSGGAPAPGTSTVGRIKAGCILLGG